MRELGDANAEAVSNSDDLAIGNEHTIREQLDWSARVSTQVKNVPWRHRENLPERLRCLAKTGSHRYLKVGQQSEPFGDVGVGLHRWDRGTTASSYELSLDLCGNTRAILPERVRESLWPVRIRDGVSRRLR